MQSVVQEGAEGRRPVAQILYRAAIATACERHGVNISSIPIGVRLDLNFDLASTYGKDPIGLTFQQAAECLDKDRPFEAMTGKRRQRGALGPALRRPPNTAKIRSVMSDGFAESEWRPIEPNPYIVGNPIRDATMFFGREAEFEFIRSRFQHSTSGGLIVLCGERRSGKTSILYQILDGRLGPDFIPVLIDMQSMVIRNEEQFLLRIAKEILDVVGPADPGIASPKFVKGTAPATAFYNFVDSFVRAFPGKKPILLFDEYELFEPKIESGVLSADVISILAGLMERCFVFLVFTGSEHLEHRKHGYWRILPKSMYRRISYLHREDALRLIREPVAGRVSYADGSVETILRLTSGHPFYTQAVCQSIIDVLNEQRTSIASAGLIADVVNGIVHNPFPQMLFLWEELETEEKLTLALLAETLRDGQDFTTPERIVGRIRKEGYPLPHLNARRIAPVLENLFGQELVFKGVAPQRGYAFRMDLWRFWIARMHSAWREARLAGFGPRPGRAAQTWTRLGRRLRPVLACLALVAWTGATLLVTGAVRSSAYDRLILRLGFSNVRAFYRQVPDPGWWAYAAGSSYGMEVADDFPAALIGREVDQVTFFVSEWDCDSWRDPEALVINLYDGACPPPQRPYKSYTIPWRHLSRRMVKDSGPPFWHVCRVTARLPAPFTVHQEMSIGGILVQDWNHEDQGWCGLVVGAANMISGAGEIYCENPPAKTPRWTAGSDTEWSKDIRHDLAFYLSGGIGGSGFRDSGKEAPK